MSKTPSAKNTSLYFDNWVINKYKNGTKKEYVIRYEPTEKWYYSSNDFKIYSGRITFYTTTGKRINSILMREGQVLNKAKSNLAAKTARGTCHLRLKQVVTICTDGGHLGGSGNTSGVGYTTTYYYEVNCVGGGGGGNNGGHDGGFGGGGGGGNGNGNGNGPSGESEPNEIPTVGNEGGWAPPIIAPLDDLIIKDDSFENNPCLNGVYNDLDVSAIATDYLSNFEGQRPVAHLKFSASNFGLSRAIGAFTYTPQNFVIEIEFNLDELSRPRTSVARTFMHEIIHAEIYRKLLSAAQNNNLNPEDMTRQQEIDYVNSLRNNFPGLYDYFIDRYKPNWDHEMMGQHYRNTISDFLMQFDPSLAQAQADALAWVGLMGVGQINSSTGLSPNPTAAWKNVPKQTRLNIINAVRNFNNNNPDC